MTDAQRAARNRLLPRYGVAFAPALLDLDAIFARQASTILEIGCGMGETTAEIAAANPQLNYLGLEVHAPGVGSLLRLIEERALENVRVIEHDAVEVLQHMIAPRSLAGVHIFFPDPWPKKRHHKRRLLQPDTVRLIAMRLAPGGYLHVATDWEDYAGWILGVLGASPELSNTAADYAPRPAYRPLTKFERRGLRLGHTVRDLVFRRTGVATTAT